MSEDWPFEFSCRRSGNCCTRPDGRVRIAEDDIAALAAASELSPSGFRSRWLVPGPDGDSLLKLGPDGACPFVAFESGRASCSVYEARPEHCRSFPFWPELAEDGPALREAARFCPGITLRETLGDES